MKEFRNWSERNKSISDITKKLSLLFGFHEEMYLTGLFKYLNSGSYENKISDLSMTEIEFCDIRKVIDFTKEFHVNLNLDDYYLYMGSCEMYYYFFIYDKTDDDDIERFIAVDHETGVIEHTAVDISEWFYISLEEQIDITRESI